MSIIKFAKNNRLLRGVYYMWSRNFAKLKHSSFGYKGRNVVLTPPLSGNMNNVYIYDNVGIGPHALLSSPHAKIIIKGNCAIAERLTIHTGNHARVVGKFVSDINEDNKPLGFDKDVIIEEDVWVGSNVTILSGVHIGRGVTIAAGAVVNRDTPPYCLIGGIPAKPIKFYWTIDQIIEHEAILYPEEERYSRESLTDIFKLYAK